MDDKDGHRLKLEKLARGFSIFNAIAAKIEKLMLADNICFDMFFINLQVEHFCIGRGTK